MFTCSMGLSEHGVHRYPKIDQNGNLNGNGKFKKPFELGRDPIPRQTRVSTNKETQMYYVWEKHGLPRMFETFETGFQNISKRTYSKNKLGIYMLGLKNTGDGSQPMESPNINMAGIDGCSSPK